MNKITKKIKKFFRKRYARFAGPGQFSAYLAGTVIEDFFWFVVNTEISFKEAWNPKFASYYPWLVIGKFRIPVLYLVGIGLSVLVYIIFVR